MLLTGTVDVTFSKVGYFPKTETVSLSQGVITNLSTQLTPIPPYSLTVKVQEAGSLAPISNANIKLQHALITHTGSSNGVGEETFTLFYQDTYDIHVGLWGHDYACMTQVLDQNTGVLTISLGKGYHDNFEFDLGWSVSGNAAKGMWEEEYQMEAMELLHQMMIAILIVVLVLLLLEMQKPIMPILMMLMMEIRF